MEIHTSTASPSLIHPPVPPPLTDIAFTKIKWNRFKWPVTFSHIMGRTKKIVKYRQIVFVRKATVVVSKIALTQFLVAEFIFRRSMAFPSIAYNRLTHVQLIDKISIANGALCFPWKADKNKPASVTYRQTKIEILLFWLLWCMKRPDNVKTTPF